jgi:predicted DNA-binding transcriptional regulator YafY
VIDRLERLINLIIALRETRRPLTAAEIRARVAGYGPRYGQQDPEAFRRMFERDKADLRALGVPVETTTVEPLHHFGDDRVGYRIDAARYDLPAVELDPEELAALSLAVQATGLADDVGWALRKLAVDTGDPEAAAPIDPGLGLDLHAPHREVLMAALQSRTPVRFRYRALSAGGPSHRTGLPERTVEPHALVHRRGRWYMVGHDQARGARRAFRLDRIEGAVNTVGAPGAFEQPAQVGVDDVVPAAAPDAPPLAEVRAASEVAWLVARRARGGGRPAPDGWVDYDVPVGDPDAFVGWVLELGPDVVVTAPVELRRRIVAALDAILERPPGVPPQRLPQPGPVIRAERAT